MHFEYVVFFSRKFLHNAIRYNILQDLICLHPPIPLCSRVIPQKFLALTNHMRMPMCISNIYVCVCMYICVSVINCRNRYNELAEVISDKNS